MQLFPHNNTPSAEKKLRELVIVCGLQLVGESPELKTRHFNQKSMFFGKIFAIRKKQRKSKQQKQNRFLSKEHLRMLLNKVLGRLPYC